MQNWLPESFFGRVLKEVSFTYFLVAVMSEDAEKVKRLVAFKEKLAKKLEELKAEVEELETTLETVNSVLLEKGFKRAQITSEASEKKAKLPSFSEGLAPELSPEQETGAEVVPLKASSGELLAILHVGENSLHVFPAADKDFRVTTPPFTQFLVERVLAKMQERDGELVKAGQLSPDRVFSYSIVREGDVIREIVVKNVDAERLRELKSSVRWTLEKMYEKTKGTV
ncbi:MAG: hypothetical protein QXJ02_06625 [Candidatus Bathyarchaeia archaeon]